jgi:tight adherence protein C
MTPIALALATFVSLAVLTLGTAWLAKHSHAGMFARLRALTQPAGATSASVTVLTDDRPKHPLEKLRTRPPKEPVAELVRQRSPKLDLGEQLTQAGIRRPNALALLMGIRIALAAAFFAVGLVLATVVSPNLLPASFTFGLIGFVIPRFVVARLAENRRSDIQRHLPDAIDLLLLCVEAGLGLNAALVKVAEERSNSGEDPIGQELTQLAKELQVGVGRREAFRNLADRTGAAELRSLAAHLIHAERFGSSIGSTLRTQAESIRTHRRLLAEEMANRTQIKLLFPLIMFIFPSVMIVILMPAVMRLLEALRVLV